MLVRIASKDSSVIMLIRIVPVMMLVRIASKDSNAIMLVRIVQ